MDQSPTRVCQDQPDASRRSSSNRNPNDIAIVVEPPASIGRGIGVGDDFHDICGAVYSGSSAALLRPLSGGAACFAAGTRVSTLLGDVPIEKLRVGDPICVLSDDDMPAVKSIGVWRADCRHHPHPADMWPIRIAAGAFGPGLPRRELELSPDHAVFLPAGEDFEDGALIPARCLVNGATITQIPIDSISYFNIELSRPDVVFAEGLPVETFHSRADSNDFGLLSLEAEAVAPYPAVIRSGPRLAAARERLRAIAGSLGHLTTSDHDMHLMVDGARVDPVRRGQTYMFRLPDGARCVWLASRNSVPAEMNDSPTDMRRLGVAVGHVVVDGRTLALAPGRGWHQREAGGHIWTDGAGALLVPGVRRLDVTLALSNRYWMLDAVRERCLAATQAPRRRPLSDLRRAAPHTVAA